MLVASILAVQAQNRWQSTVSTPFENERRAATANGSIGVGSQTPTGYNGEIFDLSDQLDINASQQVNYRGRRRINDGASAGDPGTTNDSGSPIGEPYILALMAVVSAGTIALRQRKRQHI